MKIRSLELRNFRKFKGGVRVDEIGDGLNVLVGPNEYGKSTLLAAINGVIFEKATSQNERVRGFRHFAHGTPPEVDLDFDLDGVHWALHKRFAGQSGRTTLSGQSGNPLQGEAAEAELQQLLRFDRTPQKAGPGIWGTLWVQQGQSFSGANLDDSGRQSIESCLEAQVGVVTGGQRGQRIPAAVEAALDELRSSRGPRGKYKAAVDRLAEKRAEIEKLKAKRDLIFDEMDKLARLRRDRQRGIADWDEPEHRRQLKELRELRTAAATKVSQIETARKAAELAAERARRAQEEANDRKEIIDNITSLELQVETARERLEQAECCKAALQKQINTLEQQLDAFREQDRKNKEETRRLDRIHSVLELDAELRQHKDTLAKAAQLPGEITRLIEQLAANPATDENVSRVEDASSDLAAARAAARAVATVLTFAVHPGAATRVRLDGEPLDGSNVTAEAITKRTVTIEGIGEITVEPSIADPDAIIQDVQRAETNLATTLQLVGAKDLAAARRAKAERQVIAGQLAFKQREIRELAPAEPSRKLPAGLEARKARIAELQGKLNGETERLGLASLPAWAEIAEQISAAHGKEDEISRRIGEAATTLGGPKKALAEADQVVIKHERELAGLCRALDDKQETLDAGRARANDEELKAHAAEQEQRADDARAGLVALERDQGQTVTEIDIRIRRLEEVGREHHESINRLNIEIKGLETRIEDNEADGVEEMLDTAKAEEERWQRAVRDYEEDVKVLKLLTDTLRAAESNAKQLYLGPIAQRVEPFLKMLLPDTRVRFSEDLGIEGIERRGATEELGYLSVGTQEQLAVLTRLAFAELLLDKGRPATIILDDALVFSDDDRIERMFDVLTGAAEKTQIIVLTCRRRLFSRLGAPTLSIVEHMETDRPAASSAPRSRRQSD